MGDDVVCQRRVEHAGSVKLLARDRCSDHREDAGADNGSDAERGQRPGPERLFETMLRFFRVADQLIDGLAGKQLAGQGSSPHPSGCGALSITGLAGIGVLIPIQLGLRRSVQDEASP